MLAPSLNAFEPETIAQRATLDADRAFSFLKTGAECSNREELMALRSTVGKRDARGNSAMLRDISFICRLLLKNTLTDGAHFFWPTSGFRVLI